MWGIISEKRTMEGLKLEVRPRKNMKVEDTKENRNQKSYFMPKGRATSSDGLCEPHLVINCSTVKEEEKM